jgi:hypothetical protein
VVLVVAALQPLAAEVVVRAGLPDAAWLWRKALLEEKHMEVDRARRPLLAAEFLSMSACVIAVVVSVALYWPRIEAQLMVWQAGLLPLVWQGFAWLPAEASPLSAGRSSLMLILLAVAVMVATYPLLAEE